MSNSAEITVSDCPLPHCPMRTPVEVAETRISSLESQFDRLDSKTDKILWAGVSALGTSVLTLLGIILGLLKLGK